MILAFDLATQTGWAVGVREPVMGSRRLGPTGCDHARAGAGLVALMQELVGQYDPSLILFEQPIDKMVMRPNDKIKMNPATIYRLHGLAFVCESLARSWGIECQSVNMHTARRMFLGSGMVPRGRDKVKAAVMDGCRLRGWHPQNDDEGDAACVWASHAGAVGSPLFAEGTTNDKSDKHRGRASRTRRAAGQ